MATITDRSRMLDEPIPFVAPETVRRAALFAVERFGSEAGDVGISTRSGVMASHGGASLRDVLDMLGITRDTLAHGLGYADGAA